MRALSYGSFAETLYTLPAPTPAYANSTTRACVSANTSTARACKLPADYFQPQAGGSGQAIRVVLRGIYSTNGTPNLTLAVAFDTTQGTFGTQILAAGPFPTINNSVNQPFTMELDAVCTATGTSGTFTSGGIITHQGSNAIGGGSVIASTAVDNYVEAWATWGAASASNTLTLTQFTVFALN